MRIEKVGRNRKGAAVSRNMIVFIQLAEIKEASKRRLLVIVDGRGGRLRGGKDSGLWKRDEIGGLLSGLKF